MTLTGRTMLVAAVAILVCSAVAAWVVSALEVAHLRGRVDDSLEAYAALVNERLVTSGDVDDVLRAAPSDDTGAYAQVVLADGRVVPLSTSRSRLPVAGRATAVAAGSADRFLADLDVAGAPVRVLTVPTPGGALQVARTVGDLELDVGALTTARAWVPTAGLAGAALVGLLVARGALRPVRRLAADAHAIAASGGAGRRLTDGGGDELGRLARSINTLLDALQTSQQRQRRLVVDAAHELKTPLTSLKTELDLLCTTGSADETARARAAVHDLISAVDDLVELARDEPVGDADDVALDDVVRECVAWAALHHPEARMTTTLDACVVRAVRPDVARAIGNLLDNALTHSPPGAEVEVHLHDGAVTVRDHGPGIRAGDLPHLFDRFFRATDARGRPGAGLGLAVVRKVADAHGWHVHARGAPGGGAAFVLDTTSSTPLKALSPPSHVASLGSSSGYVGDQEDAMSRTLRMPARRWAVLTGVGATALVGVVAVPALGVADGTGLRTVTGTLERCGDDHCVDGIQVDFGPARALERTAASHDFDGGGTTTSLAAEVDGLVGTHVLLEVGAGSRDGDVLVVNGLTYRPTHAPPPWGDATGAGSVRGDDSTTARADGTPLVDLGGALDACGSAHCVGTQAVDLGPRWWLQSTVASYDLDGDGTLETFADEFAGLVGSDVVVQVERGPDGGPVDVHTVNGVRYRGDTDTPPVWVRGGAAMPEADPPGPPGGSGAPTDPGPPAGVDPPEGIGPPDDAGPPAGAGRPSVVGPPDDAGPPGTSGRPDDAGPSTDAGPGGRNGQNGGRGEDTP